MSRIWIMARALMRFAAIWLRAWGRTAGSGIAFPSAYGGASEQIDSRSLCIARETLARHEGLADFAFAMQGLGSGAISIAGGEEIKRRYLPRVARGEAIAAFALSEPDAGSDVGAMSTSARRVQARTMSSTARKPGFPTAASPISTASSRVPEKAAGARGLSAFVVDAANPGLEVSGRIELIAPHPSPACVFTAAA